MRKVDWTVLGVLVALTAVSCRDQERRAALPEAGPETVRVTVLPFETIGDSGVRFFGVGLASEIERSLESAERMPVIRVDGLASEGSPDDTVIARLGSRLGASHVVSGAIRRDGARTEIVVRVIRVRDALGLWSGTYWRETVTLHELPSEVSSDIAEALRKAPRTR